MNKTTRLVMPLLCFSLPVSAQDWSDGWYVGVDFAQSTVDWQSNYDQVKGVLIDTRLDDEMSGLSLNVGKRMTSWLSLEANYGLDFKNGALHLSVEVELDEDSELHWCYQPTPDVVVPKRILTSDGKIKKPILV
ncbi:MULTISPECIES: porin family protein [unclassified Vibrio]|uniref:porin family protein n=1 Tax=unclassified Vibrio TaxID=2614977 RepID=UPI0012AA3578|nr:MULTISPECIES: porin family protein [unclassified Vibrio]QFT40005.1 hypothetical protein FIU99_26810 [Vibrio sp. THAF64]QGM37870.1 hypothetical protein GGC04_26620 [Vibrio sp. THAF191d]QGN73213.1 hypothetical protein GGC03_25845 [Vibrio sp. THAF191c]